MLSHFSCVQLFATLLTIACQAPLSTGFSRQEYRSGLPRPSPGDLPDPLIEPVSHSSCIGRQVLYLGSPIGSVKSESKNHSVVSDSLRPHGLYSPWNSPGQNTGVGSLSCLQGIFPTQRSNPGLLRCRRILYQLSHKGSPLEV